MSEWEKARTVAQEGTDRAGTWGNRGDQYVVTNDDIRGVKAFYRLIGWWAVVVVAFALVIAVLVIVGGL